MVNKQVSPTGTGMCFIPRAAVCTLHVLFASQMVLHSCALDGSFRPISVASGLPELPHVSDNSEKSCKSDSAGKRRCVAFEAALFTLSAVSA